MHKSRSAALTELEKALTSAAGSGGWLVPEDLEPLLVEFLYYLSPLTALMEVKKANGTTHEINRRTGVPGAWFEGELTATPSSTGTVIVRNTVALKILRVGSGVSGFLQSATQKGIDALESEQTAAIEAMADLIEYGLVWGNAVADAFQFSGFDPTITTNLFDVNDVVELTDLDNMIDNAIAFRGVERDPKLFLMSPAMRSKVSGLQTKVYKTVQTIQFEGGMEMESYREIPIYQTSLMAPPSTLGVCVGVENAVAGTVANGTYYFRIAGVTLQGEQVSCAEFNVTVVGGGTTGITVALPAADATIHLYKVFCGSASGTHYLLTTVAGHTYTAAGAILANIATFNLQAITVPVAGQRPLDATDESIMLLNLNPQRASGIVSLMNVLGEEVTNLVQYIPLATTRDAYDFLMSSFLALEVPWERLHAYSRRVRTS